MNNRLTQDTAYVAKPFDAHDTRGLPPLNSLKAAWDKPPKSALSNLLSQRCYR